MHYKKSGYRHEHSLRHCKKSEGRPVPSLIHMKKSEGRHDLSLICSKKSECRHVAYFIRLWKCEQRHFASVIHWPKSKGRHVASLIKNSVALVRERTIPTERPPPVSEVSANFCGQRGVTWSAKRISTVVSLCFLDRSRYFFYSSSSSVDLTRLSSRPTTTQKIWQRRESNPKPLYLQPETLTTRPQRRSLLH